MHLILQNITNKIEQVLVIIKYKGVRLMISIPGTFSFAKLVMMMSSVPAKYEGEARYVSQYRFIHSFVRSLIVPYNLDSKCNEECIFSTQNIINSTFVYCCPQSDIMLRHYDKGPCRDKLGHSRASLFLHRTQVNMLIYLTVTAVVGKYIIFNHLGPNYIQH